MADACARVCQVQAQQHLQAIASCCRNQCQVNPTSGAEIANILLLKRRGRSNVQDMADARFTLLGSAKPVAEAEVAAARALFLSRHAGSFWVDFGDFTWFRLDDIVQGRLVGGFARARTVRLFISLPVAQEIRCLVSKVTTHRISVSRVPALYASDAIYLTVAVRIQDFKIFSVCHSSLQLMQG